MMPPMPIVTEPPPTPAEAEHGKISDGQRRINLIWEMTQAIVALMVVTTNLVICIIAALSGGKVTIPTLLPESLFLVIGFYFSRTNSNGNGKALGQYSNGR